MSNRDQSGGRAPNKTLKLKSRAEAPASSELPQNLRLKPLLREFKVYVSDKTLPQFQFENDSAATYLTTSLELVPRELAKNPVEHQAILKSIASGFDLTVDYADGIGQLLTDAQGLYLAQLRKELDRLSAIFPSLACKYPLFAAEKYLELVRSDERIKELTNRIESSPYRGVFAHFDALHGQAFWTDHGIDHSPCGFDEDPFEQETILAESKVYRFFRDQNPASHVMPSSPEARPLVVLRDIGRKILDMVNASRTMATSPSDSTSDSAQTEITSLVEQFDEQVRDLQIAFRDAEQKSFLDQAQALVELTDNDHLRESIEQGFASRATFFSVKQQAIIELVRDRLIPDLDQLGLLKGKSVTSSFRDSHLVLPELEQAARNPSLVALKTRKLAERLFSDEATLSEFRLAKPTSIDITYTPDQEHYDRHFSGLDPAVYEYVLVRGLFSPPLVPSLDELVIKLEPNREKE